MLYYLSIKQKCFQKEHAACSLTMQRVYLLKLGPQGTFMQCLNACPTILADFGAGEMAPRLRALAALSEIRRPVASTHIGWFPDSCNCLQGTRHPARTWPTHMPERRIKSDINGLKTARVIPTFSTSTRQGGARPTFLSLKFSCQRNLIRQPWGNIFWGPGGLILGIPMQARR